MNSFNRVILLGNLTRDPELRFTPKGTAIAKFGLAVNRSWSSDAGEKKEEVCFIDCDAFGRTAENLAQYCKKGATVHVQGRLKLDQWDDKATGQKRSKLGVVAESIQFIGGRHEPENKQPLSAAQRAVSGAKPASDDEMPPDNSDQSVPF